MQPHLLVDLSAHGFGHVAQTAPVVNALRQRLPELRVTLRGMFSEQMLRTRFHGDFTFLPRPLDVGMPMASAIDVRKEEGAVAYQRFHNHWQQRVKEEARELQRLDPQLILANVPYLSLAAAQEVGKPAIALCSLNWMEIFRHYCGAFPEAKTILGQMLDAYRSARLFLKVEPGLPMHDLPNHRPIGPVAALGQNRRGEIERKAGFSQEEHLALLALGGVDTRLPLENWQPLPKLRWLVPAAWEIRRSDCVTFESLAMPFVDILCSSDVVITKPGYGTFLEAACNGVPVVTLQRADWPETPFLMAWMEKHARIREIAREELWAGEVAGPIGTLLEQPPPLPVSPGGVQEAAAILESHLGR